MRTLDATLLAAMDTGNYDPYFLATIQDNFTGKVIISAAPTGYELTDLDLVLTVQMSAFLDVPFYRTSIVLTRGVTIAGLHYTLSTSKFTIINSTWDGNFQTFKCHLIPRVHYSAAGDQTYKQIIDHFCQTYGKTAVYKDPAAAWLNYQFLPDGKMLTLNNAQTLFQQLKQKYFIFACDNGNDEILFYTAFTHAAAPLYSITGYRFAVDYNVDQRRQYIWRDENETLHQTTPSFAYSVQPDATVQAIMSLCDLGTGIVLAGTYKNTAHGGKIFRSTDYGQTWDAGYDLSVINANYVGVYSLVHLGNGICLAAGYYGGFVLRSIDYGLTWSQVATLGTDTSLCLTDCGGGIVLVGHINPAGTPGCQVYKSTDYGATWSLAQALGMEAQVYSICYVGAGICLAGTSTGGKIYRSTDYGSNWSYVRQLGAETGVYSLLTLGGGIVLAGTNPTGTIWKSSDYGVTWTLKYSSPEQTIYTLNTLGGGVVIAGTGPNGKVYRSVDFGATWKLIQALGAENSVRSFVTLGNGVTLAGTGEHAYIYKSLNCAADLDIIHNLGFLLSTAVEPSAYFLLAQPKFDPFQVHLKYQSGDFIRVNLPSVGAGLAPAQSTYDFTCAQVTEILDLKQKSMQYRMLIGQTEWLSNTAAGPLPSTIERIGSYTPLVTAQFNNVLSRNDNNVQAAFDTIDDHVRKKLLTSVNYYVRKDGSNSNDGLSDDATGAFLTIQHAIDKAVGLDLDLYHVTIHVGPGTWTDLIMPKAYVGSGPIYIVGDVATPSNVNFTSSSEINSLVGYAGNWNFSGFKMATYGNSMTCNVGDHFVVSHVDCGGCTNTDSVHYYVHGGFLELYGWQGDYTISGNYAGYNCAYHIFVDANGTIIYCPQTVTLTGTPVWKYAFIEVDNGFCDCAIQGGTMFTGAAIGKRFIVAYNGVIKTTGSPTYFPGTVDGTVEASSTYDLNTPIYDASLLLQDVPTNDASITSHGLAPKAVAPAAGLQNILGISNAETVFSNKPLFDNTNPAPIGTASPGTSLIAARRDHVHANKYVLQLKVVDDTTLMTTGDGKLIFCIPAEFNGMNLVAAHAFVTTVATGATLVTVQLRAITGGHTDVLSTKITIDASEYTSYTAATAPVINAAYDDVATGDLWAVDVDAVGNTTPGKGLGVILTFQLP